MEQKYIPTSELIKANLKDRSIKNIQTKYEPLKIIYMNNNLTNNNMNKEFETILRWNDNTQSFDRLRRYADGTEIIFSRGC